MKLKISYTSILAAIAWILVFVLLYSDYRSSGSQAPSQSLVPAATPIESNALSPKASPLPVVHEKVIIPPSPVDSMEKKTAVKVESVNVRTSPVVAKARESVVESVTTDRGVDITGAESYRVGNKKNGVSWREFLSYPRRLPGAEDVIKITPDLKVNVCSKSIVGNLTKPGLSESDFKWCQWTLSASGGKVKVGKSYGILNGKEREKYEQLNCNSVMTAKNPSCDDSWGDGMIASWKKNEIPDVCGASSEYSSKMHCFDSTSLARFCVFENALFDFSKMKDVERKGRSTGSRLWDKGFLATDCDKKNSEINFYEFYSPMVDPDASRCNYVINETVLAYSHDNIHNLGHTMSDFMNVWAMLWLSGTSEYARDVSFLNIDALRMGHSYHDKMNHFARHYELQFARILKAVDFAKDKGTVCFKRLVFQPRPVILFTWDGWWQDMPCTFVGPSSIFQRWNLQVRNNYGLMQADRMPTNERVQVLLVIRSAGSSSHGQGERVFANAEAMANDLRTIEGITLVVQDLAKLSFEEQIVLVASSSLIIGMHGAGIATGMHMAVGSKHCCGVIEIFPHGEFKPIRGYGNMARKMGHHYERLELNTMESKPHGGTVPTHTLKDLTVRMLAKMEEKPSCMLPSVIEDTHFSSIPSAWGK